MAHSDEEVKALQTNVALTPTFTAHRVCTDKHHCESYKCACRRCCIPEGLAGACTAPFTLRWPACVGFGRMIAACGLPELLLTAALLLVTAGAVPEGARGAGGGMPAAPLGRDCAAAEAAAATAAAALARSASARAVCCAFAAF